MKLNHMQNFADLQHIHLGSYKVPKSGGKVKDAFLHHGPGFTSTCTTCIPISSLVQCFTCI